MKLKVLLEHRGGGQGQGLQGIKDAKDFLKRLDADVLSKLENAGTFEFVGREVEIHHYVKITLRDSGVAAAERAAKNELDHFDARMDATPGNPQRRRQFRQVLLILYREDILMAAYANYIKLSNEDFPDEVTEVLRGALRTISSKFMFSNSKPAAVRSLKDGLEPMYLLRSTMTHFATLPVFNVNPLKVFNDRKGRKISYNDLMNPLDVEHRRIKARAKGKVRKSKPDNVYLDFGKYYWDILPNACREEAQAMGHCATGGPNDSGSAADYLFSLRQNKGSHQHIHLTFVMHKDGTLGEMKGRGNSVPKKAYHPQIVRLLLKEHIKGISGGGYRAKNNFAITDLNDQQIDRIREMKGDKFVDDAIRVAKRDRGE